MDDFQNSIEEWRTIPEWPLYEVSNFGRIRSYHTRRNAKKGSVNILKLRQNRFGYYWIGLIRPGLRRQKCIFVHRLVAITFIGPKPVGFQIDHVDGIKSNNRVDNLKYVTQSENILRSFRLGLRTVPKGEAFHSAILTEQIVRDIRISDKTCKEIAADLGLNIWTIFDAKSGRTWKHVS